MSWDEDATDPTTNATRIGNSGFEDADANNNGRSNGGACFRCGEEG